MRRREHRISHHISYPTVCLPIANRPFARCCLRRLGINHRYSVHMIRTGSEPKECRAKTVGCRCHGGVSQCVTGMDTCEKAATHDRLTLATTLPSSTIPLSLLHRLLPLNQHTHRLPLSTPPSRPCPPATISASPHSHLSSTSARLACREIIKTFPLPTPQISLPSKRVEIWSTDVFEASRCQRDQPTERLRRLIENERDFPILTTMIVSNLSNHSLQRLTETNRGERSATRPLATG